MSAESPTRLLSIAALAALCCVHPRTITRWLAQGKLPLPIRINRKVVRFRRSDIEHWLNNLPRER